MKENDNVYSQERTKKKAMKILALSQLSRRSQCDAIPVGGETASAVTNLSPF